MDSGALVMESPENTVTTRFVISSATLKYVEHMFYFICYLLLS